MNTRFFCISIGSRFHDGIEGARYLVYEKTSKFGAKVVEQHGFGNQRALGGTKRFGPYHTVWSVTK